MSFTRLILLVLLFLCIGAFGFLVVTDIPVPQKEITKTIPNERFSG